MDLHIYERTKHRNYKTYQDQNISKIYHESLPYIIQAFNIKLLWRSVPDTNINMN